MRHLSTLLCLLALIACDSSGLSTSSTDDGDGSIDGSDNFDLIPVATYEGTPVVGDETANDIGFTVDERGIIRGDFQVDLRNDDGSTSTRSFSFEGEVETLRVVISGADMALVFSFEEDGDFEAVASGYDKGNADRAAGMFSASFTGDNLPTAALPGGDG